MRTFILRAQKANTTSFDIDDLPGAGRIDLVCRCISNAVFLSNDMRRDTIIHVVLEGPKNPPKIISFNGNELRDFYFDERNIARLILIALKKGKTLNLNETINVHPGINISKKSFEQLIKEQTGKLFYLHKKGTAIENVKFEENTTFIFGDYTGVPKNTEKFLDRYAERVKLSNKMLFASHCIIIVNNELDKSFNNTQIII
ncbi:tRNA (pseudouridine(54)-N(1))-methyltransferase TrmY [Candidatus Woesearchaeota archaeon CG10_big_fil_rev_8_21_14_0_10_30_7]|nr:MAG: tRNA (pseudouridine(54)-N(1))-methyltransferase TrmY [Candidatus Woesearchaeota archaeon CG10_big_fil_rev_8_21_14_0_10_30_7]